MKRQQIIKLFTKYGKEGFELWFSGVEGEGEFKAWYDNGQLDTHSFYKNNTLHGERKGWYPDGQINVHCFYKDGELHGEYKYWGDNGELFDHKLYKDGKTVEDYL